MKTSLITRSILLCVFIVSISACAGKSSVTTDVAPDWVNELPEGQSAAVGSASYAIFGEAKARENATMKALTALALQKGGSVDLVGEVQNSQTVSMANGGERVNDQATITVSPVRSQGVSALELAKAQREVFTRQQSLAARQVDFTQNVLQERLQKDLAIRNQEVRYTDAMINSAASKNLQTLTELEKADNDSFRGVKAFFSPDVKSVEELEAQRTDERENIRTLSNIRRTLISNYAGKYKEASFTAADLDAEALLYDQQVQDIQKTLNSQAVLLRLEAEENVADISQYSLESLKKLQENPDSTLLPQGKIEEAIVGREKLKKLLLEGKD